MMIKYSIDVEIKYNSKKNYHSYRGCLFSFNNNKLIIKFGEYNVSYDCKLISYLRIDEEVME